MFTLELPGRPPTMNASRRGGGDHWSKRSASTSKWRTVALVEFRDLVRKKQAPKQATSITVSARQLSKDRRWLQDVGAQMPAVKAAIDGLVDAGLIDDDTAEYVPSIRFDAPHVCGRDALELTVTTSNERSAA